MGQILDSSGNPISITTRSVQGGMRSDSLAPAEGYHQGKTMLSKLRGMSAKEVQGSYAKLGADIEAANPSIRSPLLNQSNFYMPESDASTGEPNRLLNQWIAYYVKWNPLVGNILDLHSELPLSRFALRGIDDPQILQFYEEMVESAELHLKMVEMLKNYFTFGEVFPYAFWSDKYNSFTDLTFLDSNFVYVKGHYLLHSEEGDDVQFFELEPDPMLQNIVKSDDYVTGLLRNSLDPEFVAAVRQNKRLMLSNFSTSMMAHKTQYSDLRGTSIVLRCLKRLLYQDKLYEAQYSIADSHINPKWIWKLGQAGDLATGGYMPTEEDLDSFRELLIQANNDPIFTIITHYAVNVEAVGLAGKILPIQPELKQIEDDVLTALFANKAVTTGQGPNFATASVAFRAMMSRYIPIRAKVDRFLYHKIFAPVAYANKFYKRKQCDITNAVRTGDDESNQLIIPQIDWRSKTNLLDDGSVKSIISGAVNTGRLPVKLLVEALDLDYEEVQNYLWNEQGSIFDPIAIESRKALSKSQTDQTMMGQPFLPKKNQPVPIVNPNPEATAKKAGLKRTADNLLSIQPLTPANGNDPVQTEIDKGKPEVGGDPEERDPMAEALKLGSPKKIVKDTKPKSKTFDIEDGSFDRHIHNSSLKKRYDHRKDSLKKVHRMQDIKKAELHEVTVDEKGVNVYRGYALSKKGSLWYAEKGEKVVKARTQADAMYKVDSEEVKLGED